MEGSLRQISLTELGDTIGTPPSPALIGSVRRNGVVQPIVVAESPDHEEVIVLRIVDGNRRIAAARSNGITHLPAILLSDIDESELSTISLVLNGFRASNYLTEFWAIKQLERAGATESDIFSITGLTRSKVQQRTNLSNLSRELFVALRNSKLYQTHATTIAKMTPDSQAALTEIFLRQGRLTQSDLAPFKNPGKNHVASTEPAQPISWTADVSTYTGLPVPAPEDTLHKVVSPEPRATSREPRTEAGQSDSRYSFTTSAESKDSFSNSDRTSATTHKATETDAYARPNSETETPTIASQTERHLRNAVRAARLLEFTEEEFLEAASRVWNESARDIESRAQQSRAEQFMRDRQITDHFPDLATHKWDTRES